MKNTRFYLIVTLVFLQNINLYCQETKNVCKVEFADLIGTYEGGCKDGYANGIGEAKGLNHYIGSFENGLPSGKGIYYYSDSVYHSGNFQDGIKEGKGETHYLIAGKPDSVISGFWSGDDYKGKKYNTYNFRSTTFFDQVDITYSKNHGNTITIVIQTTNGIPKYYGQDGAENTPRNTITLSNLTTTDGNFIKKLSSFASTSKFSATYELSKFPIKLVGTLSNGTTFDLELYKNSKWTVRLFANI